MLKARYGEFQRFYVSKAVCRGAIDLAQRHRAEYHSVDSRLDMMAAVELLLQVTAPSVLLYALVEAFHSHAMHVIWSSRHGTRAHMPSLPLPLRYAPRPNHTPDTCVMNLTPYAIGGCVDRGAGDAEDRDAEEMVRGAGQCCCSFCD